MNSSSPPPQGLPLGALEAIANAVAFTNADGVIVWVNPAFTRLTGYASGEVIGQPLLKPGAHAPSLYRDLWDTVRSGLPWSGEMINRRKDGSTYVEEQTITPVLDTHGAIPHLIAIKQDITPRRRLQEEMRTSELRFRRLFEAAQDGILLLTADTGQITDVNPFLTDILGYSRAEFLGRKLWEIGPFKDSEASRTAFKHLQDKGYIRYENLPLETRSGDLINVEFVSNMYRVDDERVIQCNIREITARARAEEALRQVNNQLTCRVNELEQRHREVALLNDMVALLQVCATVEETYAAIAQFARQLFPIDLGWLGVFNVSKNLVDPTIIWGERTTSPADPPFGVDECWALRQRRVHRVDTAAQLALPCAHVPPSAPSEYLCIPLAAQNETIGVLHLRETSTASGRLTESKRQLAVSFARNIELALANLHLRETLRTQSILDLLTGLFNRRYMEESLAREISRAARSQRPLGIIMLDLDHFKDFNDNFGHEAGDALLHELGRLLRQHVRAGDIACRYGGEEFTLIISDSTLEVTARRAEQLRELVRHLSVEYQGRTLRPVTSSFGAAIFPLHGSNGEAVLRAADAALYRAKAEGRDRVVLAE